MLHFTKGPHLGLDALEEIISRQRHSNASCGLEKSHEGDSIARRCLAFALSHRCFALPTQAATSQSVKRTPANGNNATAIHVTVLANFDRQT